MPSLYPTDLPDEQWALIQPMIPLAGPGGRQRSTDMRAVFNVILYTLRAGGQWRMLPREYPPVSTLYGYLEDEQHLVHLGQAADQVPDPGSGVGQAKGGPRRQDVNVQLVGTDIYADIGGELRYALHGAWPRPC